MCAVSIETEIGAPGVTSSAGYPENWEENPELRWPRSARTFDQMRKTDGQIQSLLRAITLPITGAAWTLEGDDVKPNVMAFVKSELGLESVANGRTRRRDNGIGWNEFLRHALLYLSCGYMIFEQVYEIGEPTPGIDGLPPLVAHLSKLAPRMPRTISRFNIANDGGLESVYQWVPRSTNTPGNEKKLVGANTASWSHEVELPIDRLVVFVCDKEGSDWTGSSILRAAWKNWFIKEKLVRVDAQSVERNNMGVPVVSHPDDVDAAKAQRIANGLRAGQESGVALPSGWDLHIKGVEGSLVDALPKIAYHNEEMGRSVLAMFLNLGHDNGARSLGETFVDLFTQSLNSVTAYIQEIVTEFVIADLVKLNFGDNEPYPFLTTQKIEPTDTLTAEGVAQLVKAGAVIPDDELENALRIKYGLPELPNVGGSRPVEKVEDKIQTDPVVPPANADDEETAPELQAASSLDMYANRAEALRRRIASRKSQFDAKVPQ